MGDRVGEARRDEGRVSRSCPEKALLASRHSQTLRPHPARALRTATSVE